MLLCFLQFLRVDDNGVLQVEAIRAIEKVTLYGTSDHLRSVIEAGAVPIMIRVLSSTNEDIRSLAAKSLGNLACVDVEYVQGILVLPALIQATQNSTNIDLIRNVTYAIWNLFSYKELLGIEVVRSVLPFLNQLLYSQDCQTLLDACETFYSIAKGNDEYLRAILALEKLMLPQLIELLSNAPTDVIKGALRLIACLSNGTTTDTVKKAFRDCLVIQHNILPRLLWLLGHPDLTIQEVTVWIIFRLTASPKKLQLLINAAIFPKLLELLKLSDSDTLRPLEFEIRKPIVYFLNRAADCGKAEHIWYFITEGTIPPLCTLLKQVDAVEGAQEMLGAKHDVNDASKDKEEGEGENKVQIIPKDLLVIGGKILKILDKMLSIPQDNKKLEFIVNSICDTNDVMNTIEKWSYRELDAFDVFPDIRSHAEHILIIIYLTKIKSNDPEKQFEALQYFRNRLSPGCNFSVQQMINSDVVSCFIQILQSSDISPALQEEAAFALVQVVLALVVKAANVFELPEQLLDHYRYLINSGAIPIMIRLLSSSNKDLVANAAYALGGIAIEYRDVVLECGALPVLLEMMETSQERLSNTDFYNKSLCVLISKLATGTRDQIQGLIDGNIFVELFDQLQSPEIYIKKEAVGVICNVIPRSNFTQISYFIDKGMMIDMLRN